MATMASVQNKLMEIQAKLQREMADSRQGGPRSLPLTLNVGGGNRLEENGGSPYHHHHHHQQQQQQQRPGSEGTGRRHSNQEEAFRQGCSLHHHHNRLPSPRPRDLSLEPASPRRARPRPVVLGEFGSPGRPMGTPGRTRKHIDLPPAAIPRQPDVSQDVESKLQEILKLSGILTIDGKQYRTDATKEMHHLGELGNGSCGHVVKMLHKPSGKIIAVKQMRRTGNREETKRITMDLDVVLKSHDCPFIVQCLGCFITDYDVWICMELMATCLDKLIKRLQAPIPEPIIGKMTVATVKALHYLKEKHGVIHRDVKPSNILLDERGVVKLCDFGISGRLVDSKAKTRSAGCAAYMAPERIDPPDPSKPDYDIRADVWSLGITLVELATGRFPYEGCRTDFEVLTKVLAEDPPLLSPAKGFSHEFCSFVKDCLTKDFKKRPKYKKLLDHSFIKQYESTPVDVGSWFRNVMERIESNSRPGSGN